MTTITTDNEIQRLRTEIECLSLDLREARETIEKLRKERDDWRRQAAYETEVAQAAVERVKALEAGRDRLREALRWTSGTLYYVARRNRATREADLIELDGVTRSVGEILDLADAALTPQETEK